jgi:hypothetical protein
MSNILIPIDDDIMLSIYQNDDTGQLECIPLRGGVYEGNIGEPVFFYDVAELEDIISACRQGDYKIFKNQYTFEFEVVSNDNQEGEPDSASDATEQT